MNSGFLLLLLCLFSFVVAQEDSLESQIEQLFGANETSVTVSSTENNYFERQPGQDDSLESLLYQLFGANATSVTVGTPEKQFGKQSGNSDSGTGFCECVPYSLCDSANTPIGFDENPCSDYLSVCCNPSNILHENVSQTPNDYKSKGCGARNPDGIGFRITDDVGNEAQYGEFLWMAALLLETILNNEKLNVYQCGASLIHPQAVLTSAQCINGTADGQYLVRVDEWDVQTKRELFPHQDGRVKTIITHPQYSPETGFNDVAIAILEKPFEIQENIDAVCLPTKDLVVENARCFASGWGKDVFEGKYQVIMKKLELPMVSRDVCQEKLRTTVLGKEFQLHSSFICAGGEEGKQDTCKGDRGSPLVCPVPGHPERYFQAGIVSWENGCRENPIPGVYANVAHVADWIDEQMVAHGLEKSSYTY